MHRLDGGVRDERTVPRHGFVQDATEREDVRTVIDGFPLHLLGRHVPGRPDQGPRPGGVVQLRRRARHLGVGVPLFGELRKPEIEHLREAVARHHDVPGLQIPMHDPGGVRLREPLGGLGEITEEGPDIGLLVMDERREGLPVDQLHRHELHGGRIRIALPSFGADDVLADLVDRHDVRVAERRRGLGLEDEPPDAVRVPDQLRWAGP